MLLFSAVQAFSLGAQFARENAMLKLVEERRKWGESPLSFFRPRTCREGLLISTLPNLSLS